MSTIAIHDIALSKLIPSPASARKTTKDICIEELAVSIATHGLLQSLVVRAATDKRGRPTGKYEVIAGGRRLAALKLLVSRKVITSDGPVPCLLREEDGAAELSLAENTVRERLHPADEYEAWTRLHHERGLGSQEIAGRFGVSERVVKQRLRLGAVSPRLMQAYREGALTLDQLWHSA